MSDKEKRKKYVTLEDLDPDIKEKMTNLRIKEIALLEQSGYKKWKKEFVISYLFYCLIYYKKFISPLTEISNKYIFFLLAPAFPLGFLLLKKNMSMDIYTEYFNTHKELNKMISVNLKKKKT